MSAGQGAGVPLEALIRAAMQRRYIAAQDYIALADSLREAARAGWPISPAEAGYVDQARRRYAQATGRLEQLQEASREIEADALARRNKAVDDVMTRVFG